MARLTLFFHPTMVRKTSSPAKKVLEEEPELSPVDSMDEYSEEDDSSEDDEFEDQGSSDEDEEILERQQDEDESDDEVIVAYENTPRSFREDPKKRSVGGVAKDAPAKEAGWMHTDDLSSDDEDDGGTGNRIGRVPLHWYEDQEHIGYDAHGQKMVKSTTGDRIDEALAMQENRAKGKFVVYDALNDKNVELSKRQIELIRRIQAGAHAHPEHDANAEYIDYFSGVNQEISGLSSEQYERKARFQPSEWEKLQVGRLLDRLEKGDINMDYLTGKIRDMNDAKKGDPNRPFLMWKGDDEDDLNNGKGPQHIAAPKMPPPGRAESYVPPEEYLPSEEDLKTWAEMDPRERPHGHLIPKKFPNLRSLGAYEHSVREAFERCLDLYLCPRKVKHRLNIDPESLVPKLPKASDLRPFPTVKCFEYETPYEGEEAPVIRCVTPSPDGQFMASAASDGFVRLWEVETARLLESWNVAEVCSSVATTFGEATDANTVVSLEWNPNKSHHCLLATVGKCIVVIATGTCDEQSSAITKAFLSSAMDGGNVSNPKAQKAIKWHKVPPSTKSLRTGVAGQLIGPVCVLETTRDLSQVRWHAKGDYFVSVSPKAGSSAVLIHQMSKGNSQQPFSKAKGEAQAACFHPSKPFLFVASQQHVRVYNLVKQNMAKRLSSGCRWISSLDVHPSGDHLIVGSLDRRMVWFDLDLGATPYKTLKYHERALRSCRFHRRYPLMASASDDGTIHVFHSMVYSDLMRNPLIVPVKILRGHEVSNKLGVLSIAFHPTQPWVFSGGADGKIYLYQDI